MYKLGVEIGGTKLQVAVGTPEGDIIRMESGRVPAPNADAILGWLKDNIPPMLEWAASEGTPVSGIGVGFGGPVESATGRILTSHQVSGWDAVEMKPWFEEQFGLPTVVANDSNAAGWGEYKCGSGRGTQTFCYMNIGSGIGGALIINGQLHDGQGRGAFEMGHVDIPNPHANEAGAYKKLEQLYSGWSIEKHARETLHPAPGSPLAILCGDDPATITAPMIAQAAEQGDECALEYIQEIARYIGLAINNSITLLHPEVFALGGGVSLMGDILLDPIRATIDELQYQAYGEHTTRLVQAELGESIVIVGALLLAG